MASIGINFRATSGFVTDGTDEVAETGTTANYPRTPVNGYTFGWEQAPTGTRDRNSGIDRRLAGVAFIDKNTSKDYRVDLPATGDYTIRLAAGDVSFSSQVMVELFDDTTPLATIGDLSTTGGGARFYDASGVLRTSVADWVANNASITKTFATTTFRVRVSGGTGSSGNIAHLFIESAGGGTTDAVGSASGTSTASGVGASTATSTGSSTGAGSATGVGASTAAAVGSASGSTTVSGVGVASTGSTGTAAGTSTASGVGASIAASVGSAEGSATVSGVGSSASAGSAVGSASGVATVSGVGASVAAAVGSATGSATVRGISPVVASSSATGGYDYLDTARHVRQRASAAVRQIAKLPKREARNKARAVYRIVLDTAPEELAPIIAPFVSRLTNELLPPADAVQFDRLIQDAQALRSLYVAYFEAMENEELEILLLAS